MNNINSKNHGDIGELNKHDTIKKIIHSLKNHYNLKFDKDLVMSWTSWEGWIGIAYLKTEYQDQNPRNTPKIALDLKRRLILHHNIDFLGLKLAWLYRLWMLGDFGDKTQKIRKDLTRLGITWIAMTWTLDRGLKATWIVNNWVCGSILKKIIPYYVHNIHKWHSYEILLKTEYFKILAFQTRGSRF